VNAIVYPPKRTYGFCLLLATVAGCAALKMPDEPVESITEKRQDRSEAAIREFEEKRAFAEFQAALARWDQGDVDGCEAGLQKLLKRNPDHRDAQALLADVLLVREMSGASEAKVPRQLERPSPITEQHIEAKGRKQPAVAPESERLLTAGYCTALENARQAEGAAADPILGDRKTSRAVLQLASLTQLTAAGKVDESADGANHTDGVESAASVPVVALLERGHAALGEGASEKAAACFRKAASIRPNEPRIPISAAVSALQTNQPELAVELLDEAKERFTDSARILRILGTAHYRLGDFESSQVALQQALSLDKSSGLTYFLLGCTLAKLGQSDLAEEHFRQARALDPKYAARQ